MANEDHQTAPPDETHFCAAMMPRPRRGDPESRAALLDKFKWKPKHTITVSFLDGDPTLQERVIAVARKWVEPGMANLDLEHRLGGPTDLRVSFRWSGSWSRIGTDAHAVPLDQPTMNFGWLEPDSPDDVLHRVVLHEFGHALGLIHEHQNPNTPIHWAKDAVYADLSGPPNSWDRETIDFNMFYNFAGQAVKSTPVDPTSIMMYPIPARWTTDGFTTGGNTALSDKDRQFIRKMYGKKPLPPPAKGAGG